MQTRELELELELAIHPSKEAPNDDDTSDLEKQKGQTLHQGGTRTKKNSIFTPPFLLRAIPIE